MTRTKHARPCLLALLLARPSRAAADDASGGQPWPARPNAEPELSPTYARSLVKAADGSAVEAVYQVPERPAGTLFVAHGCSHSATDFWPHAAPACRKCIGLPEEVLITRAALSAGLAVVAISSSDRARRCWSIDEDGPRVVAALQHFRAAHRLAKLPLAALGASSGGAFVLMLPGLVAVDAVVSQIMAVPPAMLPPQMPPTLFIHMARDERTTALVAKCVRKLRQGGGGGGEHAARAKEVAPQRPSAAFFASRIGGLTRAAATRLHAALEGAGLLDGDGMLKEDPRRSPWRAAIAAAPGLAASLPGTAPGSADSLLPDESAVSEALNVAWAMHEIVSDEMPATIAFITHAARRAKFDGTTGRTETPPVEPVKLGGGAVPVAASAAAVEL